MADIFMKSDVVKLLDKKTIVFFGDSNMRALYKDMLVLMRHETLISERILKEKLPDSVYGDKCVFKSDLHNGTGFREERAYDVGPAHLRFYFITRCYSDYLISSLKNLIQSTSPDVVFFNSCLWDLTRWGRNAIREYKTRMTKLMKLMQVQLPKHCLFIWSNTMPVSQGMTGGFLIPEVDFMKYSMRFHVAEANYYCSNLVKQSGYDVIDLHYYLSFHIDRRAHDGIHWTPYSVRHVTNLFLTHIALAWHQPLPGKFESRVLEKISNMENESVEQDKPANNFHIGRSADCRGDQRAAAYNHLNQIYDSDFQRGNNWNEPPTCAASFQDNDNNAQTQHESWNSWAQSQQNESYRPPNNGPEKRRGRGGHSRGRDCTQQQPSMFYTDFTSDNMMPSYSGVHIFTAAQNTQLIPPPQRQPPENIFNAFRSANERREDQHQQKQRGERNKSTYVRGRYNNNCRRPAGRSKRLPRRGNC